MVKRAVRSAVASSSLRKTKVRMGEADLFNGSLVVKQRVKFDDIPMESRIELLREADAWAVDAGAANNVKVPGRFLSLETLETERTVVTSDGGHARTVIPRVAFTGFLTVALDGKESVQRIIQKGESVGWEGAERWDIPTCLRNEVAALSRTLTIAKPFHSETLDVVLGPEVAGIISHESSGHPGEADRLLGREAAQAGETYLGRGSVGTKIGADVLNVVDDPTLPRSFGFYPCDEECVKARPRYLIKEGRVTEFLHNRETAAELGTVSNASSRSTAYNREPIVRMANTFVEPGDHDFTELVEGVRHGVYIKNYMEWNIDDRRYNQRYVGLEAYMIENGVVGRPVRDPVLEMTTPMLWSSVDAVGKDLEFIAAYCGKGDPMQGIPVWAGGPHVRLRNVRIGGMS